MDEYDKQAAQERWIAAAENQARLEWAFDEENALYQTLQQAFYQAVRECGGASAEAAEASDAASAQASVCMDISNRRQEAREEFVAASLWLHGCDSRRTS